MCVVLRDMVVCFGHCLGEKDGLKYTYYRLPFVTHVITTQKYTV
jgi:hypothetical protein